MGDRKRQKSDYAREASKRKLEEEKFWTNIDAAQNADQYTKRNKNNKSKNKKDYDDYE